MATAEKTIAEPTPRSPHVQLALGSVLGAIFVLLSVYVVLAGLPYFWVEVVQLQTVNVFLSGALLILVEIGAVAGIIFLGRYLEGPHPQHGLRAGVFFLCVYLLASLWFTHKVAWWFAPPGSSAQLSLGASLVVLGGLVFLAVWLFRKPGFAKWLQDREEKGWFHATSYKPTQGVRVRRYTVVALLVLGLCGIYTMTRNLGSDREGPNNQVISNDWRMHIPFLGEPGVDFGAEFETRQAGGVEIKTVRPDSPADRAGVKEGFVVNVADNEKLPDKNKLETVLRAKEPNQVIKLTGEYQGNKMEARVLLASGHPAVPILYKVHLILPVLLAVLLVWLSWRIVNLPTFGDFLIATEAEMNKVSWSSGKRLRQDTIVVLVTVIILSGFLFLVDLMWAAFLSWHYVDAQGNWRPIIGVLRVDVRSEAMKQQEKTQW